MTLEKPESTVNKLEPTAQIFVTNLKTHLRYKIVKREIAVPVTCQGTNEKNNETIVLWSGEAANTTSVPRPGTKVKLYAVQNGILYVAKGEIADVATGKQPRIRIKMEPECDAVFMRQHQRYEVFAKYVLGDPNSVDSVRRVKPHLIDISMGGFGIEAVKWSWTINQEVEFGLSCWIDEGGEPSENHPVLDLVGTAWIRKVVESPNTNLVYLGLQFNEMDPSMVSSLELWLHSNIANLRAI